MLRSASFLALLLAGPAWADCPGGGVAASSVETGGLYKIVGVSSEDGYYDDRAELIGQTGSFEDISVNGECHVGGQFHGADGSSRYFYKIEVVRTDGQAIGLLPAPVGAGLGCRPGAMSYVPPNTRVTILEISPDDAYFSSQSQYLGRSGIAESLAVQEGCFMGGSFMLDPAPGSPTGQSMYFYKATFSQGTGRTTTVAPKLASGEGCPDGAYAGPLWTGTRAKILAVHERDAWGEDVELVGTAGEVQASLNGSGCWLEGGFRGDDGVYRYFYRAAFGEAEPKKRPVIRTADPVNVVREGGRVQIADINFQDGLYGKRDRWIGQECTVVDGDLIDTGAGWLGGHLECPDRTVSFFRI
ncbi:MAG: hypothetical protein KC912_10955, partial [Proteobacteria bacterium]|nr:hypothetical protein [Pseudomonadota bacterium]